MRLFPNDKPSRSYSDDCSGIDSDESVCLTVVICSGELWQDDVPTAACNHSQVHFFTSFHLCPRERAIHYPGCLYAWDGTVWSSHRDAGRADRFMCLSVKRCRAEWFPHAPYPRCRASVCGLQPAPTQTVHPAETCKKTLITSDRNL